MARDFQKSRLYRWENEVIGPDPRSGERVPLTLRECERLAREVANDPTIKVTFTKPRKGAAKSTAYGWIERWTGEGRITLPPWARRAWVVIHEATHIAAVREEERFGLDHCSHGPLYTRLYIEALANMLGFDEEALKRSAEHYGLKAFYVQ